MIWQQIYDPFGNMFVSTALAAIPVVVMLVCLGFLHIKAHIAGTPSSIEALPAIAEAVGSRIEVWMDGGIRSGQNVQKAVALGARGTLIGRAFLYGLGPMGEAGVTKCLELIHKELDITMAFCGHTDIRTVGRDILLPPRGRMAASSGAGAA